MMDFAEIDKLIDTDPEAAYNFCKKIYNEDPSAKTNVEFMWRLAKATLLWANGMDKKNPKKKPITFEAREYATAAYALDENNFEALRWLAVTTGAATDFMGVKERVEQGKVFKEHLDKAIGIDPKEFTLLHLRGRFSFEISNLSWLERKVCNALFSTLPTASVDESLADFLEAERYAPFVWPENLLYIARCYALKKDKNSAVKYLEKVEHYENPNDATKEGLCEVRALVAKIA